MAYGGNQQRGQRGQQRKPQQQQQQSGITNEEVGILVMGFAKAAWHALKACYKTVRYDWPYVALYAIVIGILELAFGVTISHRHPHVPLWEGAVLVGVVAAYLRHGERAVHDDFARNVEATVLAMFPPRGDTPSPSIKIARAGRGEVTAISLAGIPHDVDDKKKGDHEHRWNSQVATLDGFDGWKFEWDLPRNQLAITPLSHARLPNKFDLYDPAYPATPPSPLAMRVGLAIGDDGKPEWIWWDANGEDAHGLIAGKTKSGKSVLMRCIVGQALDNDWEIIIADPKLRDYKWTRNLPRVKRFEGDSAYKAVDEAMAEMKRRDEWFESIDDDFAANLNEVKNNPFRPVLVILEETTDLVQLTGDAEDNKEAKARQAQTSKSIGTLIRRSRFVNIIVCVIMQRPDAALLGGETRSNLGTRIVTGQGTSALLGMAFENEPIPAMTRPVSPGRSRAMTNGILREIQVPWVTAYEIFERHAPTSDLSATTVALADAENAAQDGADAPLPEPTSAEIQAELDLAIDQILGDPAKPTEGTQALPPPPGSAPPPRRRPTPPSAGPGTDGAFGLPKPPNAP